MTLLFTFLTQLAGFMVLYSTSQRAVYRQRPINTWLLNHPVFSKVVGSILLLASHMFFISRLGLGIGFFFGLVSLMTICSFCIILLPLGSNKSSE